MGKNPGMVLFYIIIQGTGRLNLMAEFKYVPLCNSIRNEVILVTK